VRLHELGVDVIDCSSGGMNLPSKASLVAREPGFQVPFARELRRRAHIATMAVGLIRTPEQANAIVADGDADLVALAREHLWNPNWAAQAAVQLGGEAQWARWPRPFGWWLRRRDRRSGARNAGGAD
jgi:2,4-dienoyl-CoA reductase-like NADH-dependent reductase (Old Yellow Enzyme family)